MSNGQQQQQQQAQGSNMRLEDMLNTGSLSSNQSDAIGMRLQSGSLFNQQPLPFDHGTPPLSHQEVLPVLSCQGRAHTAVAPLPSAGIVLTANQASSSSCCAPLGPDYYSVCKLMRRALLPLQACR